MPRLSKITALCAAALCVVAFSTHGATSAQDKPPGETPTPPAGDDPPKNDPPKQDPPKQDPPKNDPPAPPAKPAADDPRNLPEKDKQARLDDVIKVYEDNKRNQDLVPVRTRRNAITFAGDLRFPAAGKFLKRAFDDDRDMTTRVAAFIAIGKCGDLETIQSAVKSALANARKEPVFALTLPRMFKNVENPEACEWLITRLDQKDDEVVAAVVEAIGVTRTVSAFDPLAKLYSRTKDVAVKFEVLRAVGRCAGRTALPMLLSQTTDADWRIRMGAVEGLGFSEVPDVISDVTKLIVRHEEPIVVETAIEALARLGTKDAVEPLIASLKLGRLRARQKARAALRSITKTLYKHEKALMRCWQR